MPIQNWQNEAQWKVIHHHQLSQQLYVQLVKIVNQANTKLWQHHVDIHDMSNASLSSRQIFRKTMQDSQQTFLQAFIHQTNVWNLVLKQAQQDQWQAYLHWLLIDHAPQIGWIGICQNIDEIEMTADDQIDWRLFSDQQQVEQMWGAHEYPNFVNFLQLCYAVNDKLAEIIQMDSKN